MSSIDGILADYESRRAEQLENPGRPAQAYLGFFAGR